MTHKQSLPYYATIALTTLLLILCSTGCAMTKSTLKTEDGALMKNWAIATAGSKITGRDLQQSYSGATPDGYQWQATTGEQTDQLQNDTSTLTLLLQLLRTAMTAPTP